MFSARRPSRGSRASSVEEDHSSRFSSIEEGISSRWSEQNFSEDTAKELDTAVEATALLDGVKELASGLRIAWSCASFCGIPDENHQNQDAFWVEDHESPDGSKAVLFGVLDGHGAAGYGVAQYVRDTLPTQLTCVSDGVSIAKAFVRTDEMLEDTDIPDVMSGAAACLLSISAADAVCRVASLGDSRALAIRSLAEGGLTAEQLSVDHTPLLRTEYDRCKESGARLMTGGQLRGVEPWHDCWEKDAAPLAADPAAEEKLRIFARDRELPGCTLTRGFGDRMAKTLGMISDPEMRDVQLTRVYRYLVVGTDGLFDALSNQRVAELVAGAVERPDGSPRAACAALVREAAAAWLSADGWTDDITVIVAVLEWLPAAVASGEVGPARPPVAHVEGIASMENDSFMYGCDAAADLSTHSSSRGKSTRGNSPEPKAQGEEPPPFPPHAAVWPKTLPLTLTSTLRAPYMPPARMLALPTAPPKTPREALLGSASPKQPPQSQKAAGSATVAADHPAHSTLSIRLGFANLERSDSCDSESKSARLNPDLPIQSQIQRPRSHSRSHSDPSPKTPRQPASPASPAPHSRLAVRSFKSFARRPSPTRAAAPETVARARRMQKAQRPETPTLLLSEPSDGEEAVSREGQEGQGGSRGAHKLGCFHKRCGSLRKTWKKRWAMLDRAGNLHCYRDANYSSLSGTWALHGAVAEVESFEASHAPKGLGRCSGFRLSSGSRCLCGVPHPAKPGAAAGWGSLYAESWLSLLQTGTLQAGTLQAGTHDSRGSHAPPHLAAQHPSPCEEGSDGEEGAEASPPTARVSQHHADERLAATQATTLATLGAELTRLEESLAALEKTRLEKTRLEGSLAALEAAALESAVCACAAESEARGLRAALAEALASAAASPRTPPRTLPPASRDAAPRGSLSELELSERAEAREQSSRAEAVEAGLRAELAAVHAELARGQATCSLQLEQLEASEFAQAELRDQMLQAQRAALRSQSASPTLASAEEIGIRQSFRGEPGHVGKVKLAFETGVVRTL